MEIENPKSDTNNVELNSSFLLPNGCCYHNSNPCINQISDIEMISIQSVSYTSLKDLLPASPPTITSPTLHNSSCHEIPIKNHLVKQAALAYLQPMCSPPAVGDKGLFARFKDFICCGTECGCLFWLNDVVFRSFKDAFRVRQRRRRRRRLRYEIDGCDYEDDEDEDEDDEKVD